MIKIEKTEHGFLVQGKGEDGNTILSSPLHGLFLRSNLCASRAADGEAWLVPFGDNHTETLKRLNSHFARYGGEIELDRASVDVQRAAERAKADYERMLKKGRLAKGHDAVMVLDPLTCELDRILKRPLTERQIHALHHLLAVGNAANLSVPGSGKTAVVLAYFMILRSRNVVDAMLVIGPGSCFEPWESEAKLCLAVSPSILRIAGRPAAERKESLLLSQNRDILMTTYHSAARDIEYLKRALKSRHFLLVLDESHYVKRPQGGILADSVLALAPYALRRVILTGTPMPNGLPDLWSQFTFLWYDQQPLGPVQQYLSRVKDQPKTESIESVRRILYPLFFRTTKPELGLPRPSFKVLRSPMAPLQNRIYRGVAERFLLQVPEAPKDRDALREWRRARAIRLLQIASNPSLLRKQCDEFALPPMDIEGVPLREAIEHYSDYETPLKIFQACELVRKIVLEGRKVILWSTFVHNLAMLAKLLADYHPVVLHGGIPLSGQNDIEVTRERLITAFKSDQDIRVMIANPAACAESISLHRTCHDAVYLDRTFNCAHYLQSLDRIHRLGLQKDETITYYIFLASGSIDEVVHSRLKEKMKDMKAVIEGRFASELPGYWSEDLGEQEETDQDLVEQHIRNVVSAC